MEKWNGKKKAITFSFDDGVAQDIRVIEILDKYGLKATFNLNSARLGMKGTLKRNGREFVDLSCDIPKIFYIWGHAFEMDAEYISWDKFEEFCKLISGRDDIYYEVNSKVIL